MKKLMKRIGAVLMAVAMMAALGVSAWADTNNQAQDADVSVSGLQEGDSVNFIQVIKWVDGTGWAWVDGMNTAAQAAAGVELPTLETITGGMQGEPAEFKNGTISAENAAKIAKVAAKMNPQGGHTETATVASGATSAKATYANAPAGLYYALVTPATADYMYNTIFVGADFKDNGTNSIAADTATVGSETNAVAKREQITLDKDSNGTTDIIKYDHNVGDVIDFTITSKVPAYGAGYISPHYVLSDTLEENLVLSKADGSAAATTDINVVIGELELAATDYTVELTSDATEKTTGFKVTLTKDGLDKVANTGVAQTITVTYKAKITSVENATVTEKTNTATVDFSNKPTDENSYSLLEDKTRHYTFSIDANLLGYDGTSYETDELVKVGLDAEGNPLEATKKYHSGTQWSELSPLQGAVFGLFKETPAAADIASVDAAKASTKIYTNPGFDGTVTSDSNGRLNITGLDAGTYYLKEISAPAGYIKDNRTFTITINATYTEVEAGKYKNDDNIWVNYGAYKVLDGYTVKVNDGTNNTTSIYTISNAGETQNKKVSKANYEKLTGETTGDFAGDAVTPISNTQGTALPSTGGIGTYIFTITGVAIMAIAAGLLIVRHKKKAE